MHKQDDIFHVMYVEREHRETANEHFEQLGDFDYRPAGGMGLKCFQCGVRRYATTQYFDSASLVETSSGAPKHAYTRDDKSILSIMPVCRFCHVSVLATKAVGDVMSTTGFNRTQHKFIYDLCWPFSVNDAPDDVITPFYVGQTVDFADRYRAHCRELEFINGNKRPPKNDKEAAIDQLIQDGNTPIMVLVSVCDKSEANSQETGRVIKLMNEGVALANRKCAKVDAHGLSSTQLRIMLQEAWDKAFPVTQA